MTGTEQFIASLVSSLAWPGAAFAIALLFRRQLADVISTSLSRFKAGPFELEFERVRSTVEAELGTKATLRPKLEGEASPGTTGGDSTSPSLIDELSPVAQVSPTAAILDAHSRLEYEVRELTTDLTTDRRPRGVVALARLALEHGLITPETLNAIEGVTTLRNLAAHGRQAEVSPERAMDYLALVDAVLFALRQKPRE
jgi:hypothetical protein